MAISYLFDQNDNDPFSNFNKYSAIIVLIIGSIRLIIRVLIKLTIIALIKRKKGWEAWGRR